MRGRGNGCTDFVLHVCILISFELLHELQPQAEAVPLPQRLPLPQPAPLPQAERFLQPAPLHVEKNRHSRRRAGGTARRAVAAGRRDGMPALPVPAPRAAMVVPAAPEAAYLQAPLPLVRLQDAPGVQVDARGADVGPGWQLALVLAFIGLPMLCLPCIAAYHTAPTFPGGDIGLWGIAACLCWGAAGNHLPSETAHSLWALVLPVQPQRAGGRAGMAAPRFKPNQWDALLAPLVETALMSGARVGLPLAGLLVALEFGFGNAGCLLAAALHLLLPQLVVALAIVLIEAAAVGGHRLANARARFVAWLASSCVAVACCLRYSIALRAVLADAAASLERPGLSLYDCCMLTLLCSQLFLVIRMYQLLCYMHERTAAPVTGEVLGEALALLDMSPSGFGCRRTRPGAAAADAAEQRARNAQVLAGPRLLLTVSAALLAAAWWSRW